MEFATDIPSLSDEGLDKYYHFLLDKILSKSGTELFRSKILDRTDLVYEEMVNRGLREPREEQDG